ncbi:hypothetical protein BH09PAT1_BH09PAT1_7770 [soil metagenome]
MYLSVGPKYQLRPEDIDTAHGFKGHGNFSQRMAKAAQVVVEYHQYRGDGWTPFTDAEIQAYCFLKTGREEPFDYLRALTGKGYLSVDGDKISVTHSFIATCFLMWPHLVDEAPRERDVQT